MEYPGDDYFGGGRSSYHHQEPRGGLLGGDYHRDNARSYDPEDAGPHNFHARRPPSLGGGGGLEEFHASRASSPPDAHRLGGDHYHPQSRARDGYLVGGDFRDRLGSPARDSASSAWNHRRRHVDADASSFMMRNSLQDRASGGGGFRSHSLHEEEPLPGSSMFGDDSSCRREKDPLGEGLQPRTSFSSKGGVVESSKPGAFCASHDAVSAKIAAFDGKGGDGLSSRFAPEPRIEIAPGHFARLRGAQETWKCIEEDFYLPVTCFCCSTEICCIMDASYVLCPQCRVVSPMEGSGGADGGVGLGFTMDELIQWQQEIILKRQNNHHHRY